MLTGPHVLLHVSGRRAGQVARQVDAIHPAVDTGPRRCQVAWIAPRGRQAERSLVPGDLGAGDAGQEGEGADEDGEGL